MKENLYKSQNTRGLMSEAKFFEAYSRFIDKENRYETWDEAIERVMQMHRTFYKDKMTDELSDMLFEVQEAYQDKLFLGAQRALQFGGDQLLKNHSKLYNCASTHCDRPEVFSETMFLLLSGAGVGFSVQNQHITKLPNITKRTKQAKTYIIPDSIEGWGDAIDVLMSSFFVGGGKHPDYEGRKVYFDLSKIRPKGALISGGFKAPGPEPLRLALDKIEYLIKQELEDGRDKLKPIVAYDIMMFLSDAVISGGVRRSATICMFSKDDEEMIKAKTGDWFHTNPQRGRSNNSVMLLRDEVTKEEFNEIINSVKHSGEPGFIFVDDLNFTLNPCVEIGMLPTSPKGESGFQVCNLTEINGGKTTSKEIFLYQCKVAAILGTLQAGYTNFKYLSQATKDIVDNEALIGVGITGVMNNPQILADSDILREGAEVVKKWNKITAKMIGINQAARTTCIKPAGNSSTLLETASGIHGEHSPRYLRHVQFNRETEVAQLFMENNPKMCEDSVWGADIAVAFPVTSPETSIYKSDLLGVKQLEYVKQYQQTWIENGTNESLCAHPKLRHNVSNTITVDDWEEVTDYIYENRYHLCGVSLLSASGDKAYPQAPFTEVLTYNQIVNKYGEVALFTSALIEAGLSAFNKDLWNACSTSLGYGEVLKESHDDLLKRDFVRRFDKFSTNFDSKEECANCLKDVYNLHKWWKINRDLNTINWETDLHEKKFTDIDTTGAQACSGGACEII